jgi:hypothetical protein
MTIDDWIALDARNRKDALTAIAGDALSNNHFLIDEDSLNSNYPRLIINLHGIEIFFRVIFSHIAGFGLSVTCQEKAEAIDSPLQANIEEMKPYTTRQLKSFAVAELPISEMDVKKIIPAYQNSRNYPAYLYRDQIEQCCQYLGARLPTEKEWEAFVRCGVDRVFPFGDTIPSEENLGLWMEFDYCEKMAVLENGIKGIFFGEWCHDEFHVNHEIGSQTVRNAYVIKGGGAYFWPWQDEEWVWCMCAMRMPSTDLDEGLAVGRIVIGLD